MAIIEHVITRFNALLQQDPTLSLDFKNSMNQIIQITEPKTVNEWYQIIWKVISPHEEN